MAEVVNITAGAGTPVSAPNVSTLNGAAVTASQVQRTLIALRTALDTAIDLTGDTANGLDVDVTRLPAITKGTQGTTGVSTQDLKDAGRNLISFFMALPIVTTNADVLMSLTGYKSGAAVAATTTPAVVTAAKTFRVTSIVLTHVSIATAGSTRFSLRANTSGVVVVGSPIVASWVVGAVAAVAGLSTVLEVPVPDGLEFAAGTGIGITIVGLSTVQALAANGYGSITLFGFEY